jgi:hypothetical protein
MRVSSSATLSHRMETPTIKREKRREEKRERERETELNNHTINYN